MTTSLLTVALIMAIAIIVLQWRHHRRVVGKVEFLFNAIDNGDYAFHYPTDVRRDDILLNASLNRIKEILQHARDEQISRERYYEVILNQVDTGILVTDTDRGIVLRSNQAARRMIGRETVTHISQVEDRLESFSVRETYSELRGRKVRILALSDIHGELANQEIDAWVKLIRVLTHEMMNSITPIVSLTQTLLTESDGKTREGLETINQTSKELMDFVENYRKFTHVPKAEPTLFYVGPFLDRMKHLAEEWPENVSTIETDVMPKDLLVYADERLVSRVVTNLLKNAAEAIPDGGHIIVKAYTNSHDNVVMDVSDDGVRIPDDIVAQIFTPFFTTKPKGSGIGLPISRQIMRTMGGMLELVRTGSLTTFRLTFN